MRPNVNQLKHLSPQANGLCEKGLLVRVADGTFSDHVSLAWLHKSSHFDELPVSEGDRCERSIAKFEKGANAKRWKP